MGKVGQSCTEDPVWTVEIRPQYQGPHHDTEERGVTASGLLQEPTAGMHAAWGTWTSDVVHRTTPSFSALVFPISFLVLGSRRKALGEGGREGAM